MQFRGSGHTLRLIEFIDVGSNNNWEPNRVVPGSQWIEQINDRWPMHPLAGQYSGETARRYAFEDGAGEIGLINSITEPFCGQCSRARVTADGTFYTCLFASHGARLQPFLRNGCDPQELKHHIRSTWLQRQDRYSQDRGTRTENLAPRVAMYRLGG